MRLHLISLTRLTLSAAAVVLTLGSLGCAPRNEEPATTPLPTRQSTIDPVNRKLDAAQQDTERRRNEVDRATQ